MWIVFTIVVTDYVLRKDGVIRVLKDTFASLGFNIIENDCWRHDKRFSETLFLTHHVGKSILKAGFTRVDSDITRFQFLMDAVESVAGDQESLLICINTIPIARCCRGALE